MIDLKSVQEAVKALADRLAMSGGRPIDENTPKDRPILAYCHHSEAAYHPPSANGLSLYGAHAEGLSHAATGFHVIVWGGGFCDVGEFGVVEAELPDWWFVEHSEFEMAANPLLWWDLPVLSPEQIAEAVAKELEELTRVYPEPEQFVTLDGLLAAAPEKVSQAFDELAAEGGALGPVVSEPVRVKHPMGHELYKTGDLDAPDQIKDRNGEVVLGMCRHCGRAEIELDGPCL